MIAGLLAFLARERDAGVPEYVPEPPDDATPALAYGLANEGGDSNDTVLATLLDLIDRGWYETSSARTDREEMDLAIKAPDHRPDLTLTPYEQSVGEFFDQLLGGAQLPLSSMKDQIPEHSELWRGRWERMTEKLNAVGDDQLAWDRDLNWGVLLSAVVGVIAYAVIVLCAINQEESSFPAVIVGAVATLVLLGLRGTRFKRLDAAHVERVERWQAFAHWTTISRGCPTIRRPRSSCGSGSSSTGSRSAPPNG